MGVNGVSLSLYWASYAAYYFSIALIMGIVWTAILTCTCMTLSNGFLIFLSLELGYLQMFAVSALITTTFSRARSAASITALCAFLGIVQPLLGCLAFTDVLH